MENQIDKNYDAFRKKLPELLKDKSNLNKFSLWHKQEMVDIYDTEADAIKVGKEKYKAFGNFSVQKITEEIIDLGYISTMSNNISQIFRYQKITDHIQ